MAFQIVLNLIIAFVWMFLNAGWEFLSFFLGYVYGAIFLFALRRFFNQPFYLRKVWAICKLLLLFLKELVLSNVTVIRQVLSPPQKLRPGIFALQTELKSDWEITILACLITLTPGTLTLEFSPDQTTLYIHAIDIDDAEQIVRQIKGSFERAIMEVTRSC